MPNLSDRFRRFAQTISTVAGSPASFVLSVLIVLAWAGLGPTFHYSDTWQLVINTSTTIITFLMVFLIQNTQNRDARELHLKLDELIRANTKARNSMIDLHALTDDELKKLHDELCALNENTENRIGEIRQLRASRDKQRQTT